MTTTETPVSLVEVEATLSHNLSRRVRPYLFSVVVLGGLGAFLGAALAGLGDFTSEPGGIPTAVGALLAMGGTYLALVVLLLSSRLPWLERSMGHDKMISWHRKVGPWSLFAIGGHVIFTTLGYAERRQMTWIPRFIELITQFAWMVPALVALSLMISLGVSSYRRVRAKLKYETWSTAHLYFYVAIVLAYGHQVENNTLLSNNPPLKNAWLALNLLVASTMLYGRFLKPVVFSLRHQLRVDRVEKEAEGVISIYLTGRNLSDMTANGGQFFLWRFLTRKWWWQAHPYSLSAAPSNGMLRITIKALGDQSRELADQLRPGTRVFAEGPYGVFTAQSRQSNSVVAFAAGIGVTPVRAMLESLPSNVETTVVYRVLDASQAALSQELETLCALKGFQLHLLEGGPEVHPLVWDYYQNLTPTLPTSDIYVCGPAGFTASVQTLVAESGNQSGKIHHEAFAF